MRGNEGIIIILAGKIILLNQFICNVTSIDSRKSHAQNTAFCLSSEGIDKIEIN